VELLRQVAISKHVGVPKSFERQTCAVRSDQAQVRLDTLEATGAASEFYSKRLSSADGP
jgi:hypothetical protein